MPLADKLLQRGELRSRLDKRDSHGRSPLDYAITKGHTAMLLFLLNQGAKQESTMSGTVLDLACQQGQTEMAEHLLNLGYPVNPNGKGVHKPAVLLGRALRYLPGVISEGVDLDGDKWKLYMKDSLLSVACVYGHAPVVKMLLERNANVNAATTKGWTPLHNAAWAGQIECVKLLLGANADAGSHTSLGRIPFHCAASRGKVAIVQLFLDGGISVNAMTAKQKHSLHLASYSGQAVVVKLLIERGAMIDARSYKG
ncbi:ankyrin repeat-containing domain protein [Hyaloscypha sp. PMI_1271]|nr:ankyrin repeat-containing domain protein [Hyaloscypha sp. PMI_1271]